MPEGKQAEGKERYGVEKKWLKDNAPQTTSMLIDGNGLTYDSRLAEPLPNEW